MKKLVAAVLGVGVGVLGACESDGGGAASTERAGQVYAVEESGLELGAITAQEFVAEAASGGLFEVESSRLALRKSNDPETRAFAQRMIDDHTRANEDLKAVARRTGLDVPNRMSARHQRMLDELQGLEGEEFTRRYHEQQDMAHAEAIDLFDAASQRLRDTELVDFAERTRPVLVDHHRSLSEHRHGG